MSNVKTACVISCSDHYGHRLNVIADYLRSVGYEVTYITSDFDHTSKQNFVCSVPGCVQLHAKPYRKNLSVDRILSHRMFARDVFRYLEKQERQPDVVVSLVPPNFLVHYGARYKKKHPNVYLIFDIFDMWPETFPFGRMKKLLAPVFCVWAWIRDHSLSRADYVTTECEMFRRLLKLPDKNSRAIYLCAPALKIPDCGVQLREDSLELCYLGAINNVIDIPAICGLLRKLVREKPVTLHIIGKGERQQELIDSAKSAGAQVHFHGAIYDDEKKQQIINRCHFGLNMMKSSVCVGLTMKSIDYFRFGLPIINNIPADTEELVRLRNIGIQCGDGCERRVLDMTAAECAAMRENVKEVFETTFEKSVIDSQYRQLFDGVL
ncbi:MAG: glycosyltransferase [Oscillospiraceae bacterium]|nr:glycosyltransferase [Oscillospiraceae bacterium]